MTREKHHEHHGVFLGEDHLNGDTISQCYPLLSFPQCFVFLSFSTTFRNPASSHLLPWTKKEPCSWCIKSKSCDVEESRCLIQLRNRERMRRATAATSRIVASRRNQTADSSISHDASQGWFFFLSRVALFRRRLNSANHPLNLPFLNFLPSFPYLKKNFRKPANSHHIRVGRHSTKKSVAQALPTMHTTTNMKHGPSKCEAEDTKLTLSQWTSADGLPQTTRRLNSLQW